MMEYTYTGTPKTQNKNTEETHDTMNLCIKFKDILMRTSSET